MPLSALATGVVDQSAPANELPKFLTDEKAERTEAQSFVVDESPMDSVFRLLRDQFGLDFSVYKTGTVSRRILRRVELVGSVDLEDYALRLRTDPTELSALYHDLLIGVTRFFRDPEAFEVLEKSIVPQILERVPEGEEIRIWIAACATGEEAYSVAMILFEQLTAADRQLNVKILSTDVHAASLAHASAGVYGEEQLEHVSEARRERFFRKKSTGYHISQDLRQLIVFAPHNLTKDAPFTKMHLISCRNLLIYLEPAAQKSVLALFHFGLASNGFLFLGSSETPGALAHEFDTLDEHSKIYRKRRDIRLLEPLKLPMTRKQLGTSFIGHARSSVADAQLLPVYDQLLDRHMPPSFLVDEDRHLLDSFGGAERLFRVSKRRPSMNILDLLEGDLRTVVAGAIQRALKREGAVRYSGVPIPDGNGFRRCMLSAELFANPRTGSTNVLIAIEAEPSNHRRDILVEHPGNMPASQASHERMVTLEGELSYTRETLQSTIEELQTSNEELQAANEELVASNEELQSTNEELHSVNEELYSVNAELQRKIAELRELNSDMQHFLESTDVGTLFLDRRLCIRKYTPRIAGVFRIEAQDIGRSIRHFSHSLKRPALLQDIERVLDEGVIFEDEVRDGEGTTFFLRILPYRAGNAEGVIQGGGVYAAPRIEGVVLSLTDISALDRVRSKLRQLSAIVESSDDAIIGTTLDGTITTWNRGAERLYGYGPDEAIGSSLGILAAPAARADVVRCLASLRRGERMENVDLLCVRKDGRSLDVSVIISPVCDSEGEIVGASAICRDVAALRMAQQEVEERESQIRLLLDSTAEAVIGLDTTGRCTFCNPASVRLLGCASAGELTGGLLDRFVRQGPEGSAIFSALRTGEGTHSEEVLWRADDTHFLAECWSYPIRRGGMVVGVVLTFLDITDRKAAEEEIRTGARRREEFLAMLSHELRNPLSAVVSATRVMRSRQITPELNEKARQIVERQSRHMARLLDDLLDVSRITRGGIELRKEDVDVRDAITAAIEALSPVLQERDARIVTDISPEMLCVRGDSDRIQQVLVNLVSNAARYSPQGKTIHISAGLENDMVTVRVKDEGRGIAPNMLTKIFELFVQGGQGLDRASGGLGIGLTLVRKIVELHGGTITAYSDGTGSGSEFVVKLPIQRNAVVYEKSGIPFNPVSRRIVIVEDQDDSRQMLRVLLETSGHKVIEEADGISAADAIEREHPDVALIDIGLPAMDGYEVARRVRANPVFDDVVLVALTGYGMDTDVKAAKDAGFDDHLTKPVNIEAVEGVLSRRSGRRRAS